MRISVSLYNYAFRSSSIVLITMIMGLVNVAAIASDDPIEMDSRIAEQLERGQMIYKKFCAICHGTKLEGQPNWRIRKPDGKLPAPPHDETGHTWHHPDDVLFGIIKNGLVPPYAPENYSSDMPAWGSTLSDADIWAVLAYIKSRWPDATRKTQQEANQRSLRQRTD